MGRASPHRRDSARAASPVRATRDRLPPAPKGFVGRRRERVALERMLQRAPLAIVWGPGGIGKTSLVLQTVHAAFQQRSSKILYVGLRPADRDPRARVLRALVHAAGAPRPDWSALGPDIEPAMAAIVDLADVGDSWIVIDDAQFAEPKIVLALLTAIERYARRSRWIVVSRTPPHSSVPSDRALALGQMSVRDMQLLATRWIAERNRPDIRRAIGASGGSPWALRRALFASPVPAVDRTRRAPTLPANVRSFVAVLARLEQPLPLECIGSLVALPAAGALATLERHGLIEIQPRGVRLHDAARTELPAILRDVQAPTDAAIAHALATQVEPLAVLESLRLLLHNVSVREVSALLDLRGAELLAAGFAPELWHIVEPVAALALWKLRVAVEFDHPDALRAVVAPAKPCASDRLAWSKVLYRRGEFEPSERAVAAAVDSARKSGDVALEAEAVLFQAGVWAQRGRPREALESLVAIRSADPCIHARRASLEAMLLAGTGARALARERVDAVRELLPTLPPPVRAEVAFGITQSLYFQGAFGDADEIVRSLVVGLGEPMLSLYHGRRLLYYRASIALERGRLGEANELLTRLDPYAQRPSMFRPYVDFAWCVLAVAQGDFARADALIPALVSTGEAQGRWGALHVEAALQRARIAMLRGEAPELPHVDELPPDAESARTRVTLVRAEGAGRAGVVPHEMDWRPPDELVDWGDTRTLAWLVRARVCVAIGRDGDARIAADHAAQAARHSGSVLAEAESVSVLVDIAIIAEDLAGTRAGAERLREIARDGPSPRFGLEAEWCDVSIGAEIDPAKLERIASARSTAPVASRRAAALLGDSAALDAIDRRVLDAVRRKSGATVGARVRGVEASRWGMDVGRHRVWRPDGSVVEFGERPLFWKLLGVLAQHEGTVSKEQLLSAVWDEQRYHPLRHDNRLRLAVRKLRQLIEPDPDAPVMVVTTDDGYRLGGTARLWGA